MSVEKPQLEAFWKSEKGPEGKPSASNGVKKKGEADLSAEALAKAGKISVLTREIKEAGNAMEKSFSQGDFGSTLDDLLLKLRELQRTVGMELIENREQYEKFEQEFNRQIENLSKKGFPKLAGMDEKKFATIFEPLKEQLKELSSKEFKEGRIPFVVVPREKLLALEKEIPLMEVDGKKGFTTLNLSELKTADGVEIPESLAYLVIDVENGKVMLGKSADEAVKQFKKEERSPLTAEEGVAIILQHPEILKDHYMDLGGSRYGGGRGGGGRVAHLWLNEGRPKLNWYWADDSGARWGSASCGSRVGP